MFLKRKFVESAPAAAPAPVSMPKTEPVANYPDRDLFVDSSTVRLRKLGAVTTSLFLPILEAAAAGGPWMTALLQIPGGLTGAAMSSGASVKKLVVRTAVGMAAGAAIGGAVDYGLYTHLKDKNAPSDRAPLSAAFSLLQSAADRDTSVCSKTTDQTDPITGNTEQTIEFGSCAGLKERTREADWASIRPAEPSQ